MGVSFCSKCGLWLVPPSRGKLRRERLLDLGHGGLCVCDGPANVSGDGGNARAGPPWNSCTSQTATSVPPTTPLVEATHLLPALAAAPVPESPRHVCLRSLSAVTFANSPSFDPSNGSRHVFSADLPAVRPPHKAKPPPDRGGQRFSRQRKPGPCSPLIPHSYQVKNSRRHDSRQVLMSASCL